MKGSSKLLIGLGAAVVLVVGGTGGAVAAQLVTSAQIKNGTIQSVDLNKALNTKLSEPGPRGLTGPRGLQGLKGDPGDPASDLKGELASNLATEEAVTLTHVGGPFAANATTLGTFELEAGTYLINAYGFFDRINNGVSSSPTLMLAVRANGADLGTAFTANFPATGDREQTASSTRIVTLDDDTTVTVFGFGYNNDGSAAGSNNYTVAADVNAIRVG